MQRREFLAGGGLFAASAAWPVHAMAMAPAPLIVLFDGRAPEARRFAQVLRRQGAAAFDIEADMARLWYGALRRGSSQGRRVRIAGLASWADFVVARGCAMEAGFTLTHHAVHDLAGPSHKVIRSDRASVEATLAAAEAAWPEALASLMAGLPAPSARVRATRSGTLASWAIS